MFVPNEGAQLVIMLPGERLRTKVYKVIDADNIIAELISVPLSKAHTYAMGNLVACKRDRDDLNVEVWRAYQPYEMMSEPEIAPIKKPSTKRKNSAKSKTTKSKKVTHGRSGSKTAART